MKPLTPSEAMEFITNALFMREVPYVAGVPAIGKSSIAKQVAKQLNLLLITEYLSQKLPEDLTGLPMVNEKTKKAEYTPFSTFPLEGDEVPADYDGWLILLDELSSSSEEIMAAIYSLVLERTVGGRKLHPRALVMAAGNRSTDSAIARPLPDTLITRMLPFEMTTSSADWVIWASDPATNSHQSVVEFIKKYPDLLLSKVDPSKREELETYPTPRGWAKVFKIVKLHEKQTKTQQITRKDPAGLPIPHQSVGGAVITPPIHSLLRAAVGVAAAKGFQEHYDEAIALPYPWEVAQSPGSTKIPTSTIGKAKLTADLADHFLDTQDQSRDAILQYMNRMDNEHAALFVQMITEKLGQTVSDLRMIENVKKRLNVTLLDPTKPVVGYGPGDVDLYGLTQNTFSGGVQGVSNAT